MASLDLVELATFKFDGTFCFLNLIGHFNTCLFMCTMYNVHEVFFQCVQTVIQ